MSDEFGYGIHTVNGQTSSYIYLVGIQPESEIHFSQNVKLVPVKSSPAPDDMIDCIMKYGNGDEYALGLLIATLRSVTAQLVITAASAKELAIATWNAQTLCVLISAMLNCEVSWYFQADKSADIFDAHTRVSLVHAQMHKFPSELTVISKEQCHYLENNLSTAWDLDNDQRFRNATNALWTYLISPHSAIQLSIVWGGIESMFLIERGIKQKLAKAASRFLNNDDSMINDLKTLYEYRCKAVHEYKNIEHEVLRSSVSLLYQLIKKCIETKSIPNVEALLEENNQ